MLKTPLFTLLLPLLKQIPISNGQIVGKYSYQMDKLQSGFKKQSKTLAKYFTDGTESNKMLNDVYIWVEKPT